MADVDLLAGGEQDIGRRVVAGAVLVGPCRQVAVGGPAEPRVAVQGPAAVGAGVGQQLGDQEARVVGVADARQEVGGGVLGEGALRLLQVGDEAVDRDDRLRPGQHGRRRPGVGRPPGPEARGGVAPAQLGGPLGRGPQAAAPAERRAVGVDVVDGREQGPDGGHVEGDRGRPVPARPAAPSQFSGSGSHHRVRSTDPSRTSMPINAESGNPVQENSGNRDESSRPGGGRWPSGSARGGWTAGACAAPTTRGSRPSSPTGAGGARPPCR